MNTITKREIIDAIAKEHKVPRQVAKLVVQRFLESVIEAIRDGNRLEFRDFGVFEPRERAAFTAQNPRTMAPVEVPARWVIKFKPGRKMQQALDEIVESPIVTAANPEVLDFMSEAEGKTAKPVRQPIKLDPDDTNN